MIDWVPETWVFSQVLENWGLGKLNKAFLHFFAKIYDVSNVFAMWSAPNVLPNIKKSSNMTKTKKNLVLVSLNSYFG